MIAGLVWNLFLTDYSMGYTPANFLLHVVVPVLALAEWLATAGRSDLRWWHPWAWLAYPGCYVVIALAVLNQAGRRAPYYFLDPGSVGTFAVGVNIGLLGAIFLALGYVLMAFGRTRRRVDPARGETPGRAPAMSMTWGQAVTGKAPSRREGAVDREGRSVGPPTLATCCACSRDRCW